MADVLQSPEGMPPLPWYANPLVGAALGLAMGALDTASLYLVGVDFSWGGRDVTLLVGAFFSCSFVALGWMAAHTTRARHALRAHSRALQAAEHDKAQLERLAALGALAGTVAHEVRNPLAIIRTSVQNLGEAHAEAADSCRFVIEEIDRLSEVTRSLVAFAKPLEVRARPVQPGPWLAHTAQLARLLLERRGLRLEAVPVDDEAPVDLDPDLVTQLLLGLVENAAELAPEGSTVTLRYERAAAQAYLHVQDEGPGVPDDVAARIFEPLFTTRPDGAGIGLAVAKQIAEAHAGALRLEPSDRGAHFVVELPAGAPA